jgi:predicted flap endonuclease-1-like 5' DNA nuclease
MLNGIGVHRFKQVAAWTDAACAEFSKLLTFKNRIYTDNWLGEAKGFHGRKYGEKL